MIILFGPAGSGKSTQGEIIAEKYGCAWLSIGEMLRERAKTDAEMAEVMRVGGLVDDRLVVRIMDEEIAKTDGKMVILDGYPRNLWQAEWLVKHDALRNVGGTLVLDGDRENLVKRLLLRGRPDDTEEVIRGRFNLFDKTMSEILPLLEGAGVRIEKVDCVGSIEEVTERIEKQLALWGIE